MIVQIKHSRVANYARNPAKSTSHLDNSCNQTMDNNHSIEVHDLSKRFKLYHEKATSLKEKVVNFRRSVFEEFWALKNIDFYVEQGETVGIVGRNGSGKSTLLKCVAGILRPTSGEVLLRGQISSLLELGAGFQPELSGRDNIYLNASLLGIPVKEVAKRFDDIVAFAELEHFIDNQVKFYSSGMYVRLGFAVAINVQPDILIVDEVLAVGDENFQAKCLDKIREMQRNGTSILFVTHSPDLTKKVCSRAVVLQEGDMVFIGEAKDAIDSYHDIIIEQKLLDAELGRSSSNEDKIISVESVSLKSVDGQTVDKIDSGDSADITVQYKAGVDLDDCVFIVEIQNDSGTIVFSSNTDSLEYYPVIEKGTGNISFTVDTLPLTGGIYMANAAIRKRGTSNDYDRFDRACTFKITAPENNLGIIATPVQVKLESLNNTISI